jgi:hypothetical protein
MLRERPLQLKTPRTLDEASWHRPEYFHPFEHYTKPLHQRLFFWLGLAAALALIAFIWSGRRCAGRRARRPAGGTGHQERNRPMKLPLWALLYLALNGLAIAAVNLIATTTTSFL